MVKSAKTSSFIFESEEAQLTCIVETNNQSLRNQPILWFVHGSGGISSSEDIWKKRAFDEGYTCVTVDSYTSRHIFKMKWDGQDKLIRSRQRCHDIINARNKFLELQPDLYNWTDITNNKILGFSDGGTVAIRLVSNEFKQNWISTPVFALYPSFVKADHELYNVPKNSVHILVGEHDNWTPAVYGQEFCDKTKNKITVFKNTHHSFSKPGVAQWHHNVYNYKSEKGVYCEYNEKSTELAMDIVFKNDYNNFSA
jgi:dienelactone hydrolase